jgi:DNA-binding CsgD family transcriptional regulator
MHDVRSRHGLIGAWGEAPKRHIPRLTLRALPRDGLPAPAPLQTAEDRDHGTVVLVTGAVGAGKTSLLASWSGQLLNRGHGVGWASLGREDNDTHVLWGTVLGALRDALTRLPEEVSQPTDIDGLVAPPEPDPDFVGRVATAVAAAGGELWVMLDDVHTVRDQRCLESLDLLLRWAPPNLHFVLGARADPALRLARLRLEGRFAEVRDEDLRFSLGETAALLTVHGVSLSPAQLSTLHRLTEGWAAGVGLAALSLSTGRDPDTFLLDFASDDGAMAGYLIDEVLDGLDDDRRDFLLATCLPEHLSTELAVRLSCRDDAGSLLDELAATNTLVTAGIPEGGTYRYHALLRSYLRARLQATSLSRTSHLHAETSAWFADHGLSVGALEHGVASGDEDLVRAMLHRYALGMLLDGRLSAVERAVANAPARVRREPAVLAIAALTSLEAGDRATAEMHLAAVGRGEAATGIGGVDLLDSASAEVDPRTDYVPLPVDRLVSLARHYSARLGGQPDPSVTAPGVGDAIGAPEGDPVGGVVPTRGVVPARGVVPVRAMIGGTNGASGAPRPATAPIDGAVVAGGPASPGALSAPGTLETLGAASAPNLRDLDLLERLHVAGTLISLGRYDTGRPLLESAMHAARRMGRDYTVIGCLAGLAGVAAAHGDLDAMERWAGEALVHAGDRGWAGSPRLLLAYVLTAAAAYQGYDMPRARRLTDIATAILDGDALRAEDGVRGRGIDVDREVLRGVRSIATYVDFALSADDPARQRDLVSSRSEAIEELGQRTFTAPLVAYELAEQHRMALVTGQLAIAARVEGIAASRPELAGDLLVMRALHALRLGHDSEARAHLVEVTNGDITPVVVPALVAARLVEVTVALRNDQATVAHEALLAALDLAAPRHGIRMMLQVSTEVVSALHGAVGRFGRHEAFVEGVLGIAAGPAAHGDGTHVLVTNGTGSAPLLSPRELSLLRDLPSMLTVAEIAQARAVSANTVKTQLRSLFEKLGVSTRRDAVAAGRREGLI